LKPSKPKMRPRPMRVMRVSESRNESNVASGRTLLAVRILGRALRLDVEPRLGEDDSRGSLFPATSASHH
jgi:hypothetical protein